MNSTTSTYIASGIPVIQITPSSDDANHYTTSDILYNYSDEKSLKNTEIEVRRPRFKPSLPNRSKSSPLPSDDEDSSQDEQQQQQQQPRVRKLTPQILWQSDPSHLQTRHHPFRKVQPLRSQSDHTRATKSRRPIPPPLTHIQSNQSVAYFAYPIPLQPNCTFYPHYRKPLPSPSEMVGYTFRRK